MATYKVLENGYEFRIELIKNCIELGGIFWQENGQWNAKHFTAAIEIDGEFVDFTDKLTSKQYKHLKNEFEYAYEETLEIEEEERKIQELKNQELFI